MRVNKIFIVPVVTVLLTGFVTELPAKSWQSKGTNPPRKVIVATTMFNIYQTFSDVESNVKAVESLIDQVALEAAEKYPDRGLDLIVLPETIITAGKSNKAIERALPLDGLIKKRMGAKASSLKSYLIVPVLLHESEKKITNSAILFDRSGEVAGIYRKYHPVTDYGTQCLEGGVTPGSDFPVFECDFGKLGIQICWDIVYEDGWKALAQKGAEIVALPSAAPQLVRPMKYALEGDYYIISATPEDNATIFNPIGMVHAQIKERGVLVQEIDLSYAVSHWSPGLREGRGVTDIYGERAGCVYYRSEATAILWSNDVSMPISDMLKEANLMEMRPYVELNRKAQDALRP